MMRLQVQGWRESAAAFDAKRKNAKGNLHFDEGGERLAQMRQHHGVAGDAGDFIDAVRQAGTGLRRGQAVPLCCRSSKVSTAPMIEPCWL